MLALAGIFYTTKIRTNSQSTIIVIHGCSSSGKSSTAKILQSLYAAENKPFMLLPTDVFLSFLPKKWVNFSPHDQDFNNVFPDGIRFINIEKNLSLEPRIKTVAGKTIVNALYGTIHAVDAFAKYNNNIIIEGAMTIPLLQEFEKFKGTHQLYIITITCDLAIMQERELKRDGIVGLAKSQYEDPQYYYNNYDFTVDTSSISPQEAAQKIKNFVDNNCV